MSIPARPPAPAGHPARRRRPLVVAATTVALGTVAALGPGARAEAIPVAYLLTGRVSVSTAGAQGASPLDPQVLISDDGRFVAFSTEGRYDTADGTGTADVFIRDRVALTTSRVSLTDAEAAVVGDSHLCGLSSDGRYVGFSSDGTNLPGGGSQLYLRDRVAGTTSLVSSNSAEAASEGNAYDLAEACPVSDDGRFVAFATSSDDLVGNDTNQATDVFRRDRTAGTTVRVSLNAGGAQIALGSHSPAMADDGSVVAFDSLDPYIVVGDTNATVDVFVRKVAAPASTTRVSTKADGGQSVGTAKRPSLSANGGVVAFDSTGNDLVAGDGNGTDVFVKAVAGGAVVRASSGTGGAQANGPSTRASLTDDGTRVAFTSQATNLVPQDANALADVFVRILPSSSTWAGSAPTDAGGTGDGVSGSTPSLSGDGAIVAFASWSTDLVRNDTNAQSDAFVRGVEVYDPFATRDAFIQQQHVDFLGHAATATQLASWRDRLTHREATRARLVATLLRDPTFAGHRAPLARLYWAFFQRRPDASGYSYWLGKLDQGKGLAPAASSFAASSEFQSAYGTLGNGAFVTEIYQHVFDRDPDVDGLAYWTGKLDQHSRTRGQVVTAFSESSEGRRLLAPQVDTILLSLGLFRYLPPTGFFQQATAALAAGAPIEVLIDDLLAVGDYAERFTS